MYSYFLIFSSLRYSFPLPFLIPHLPFLISLALFSLHYHHSSSSPSTSSYLLSSLSLLPYSQPHLITLSFLSLLIPPSPVPSSFEQYSSPLSSSPLPPSLISPYLPSPIAFSFGPPFLPLTPHLLFPILILFLSISPSFPHNPTVVHFSPFSIISL